MIDAMTNTSTPPDLAQEPSGAFPDATPVGANTVGQIYLRFRHDGREPLASMTPYDLRQRIKPTLESIGASFMEVAVAQGENSVTLYPLTPLTSQAMQNGSLALMEVMADISGCMLEVEANRMIPSIARDKQTWLHQVTKLVVCTKKDLDWAQWREPQLSPAQIAKLEADIRQGIATALQTWDKPAPIGLLKVIDAGRPMVISPARGPRVLARLGVKFIADHLIEGALFIGPCNYLGMGRIMRIAPIVPASNESGAAENV